MCETWAKSPQNVIKLVISTSHFISKICQDGVWMRSGVRVLVYGFGKFCRKLTACCCICIERYLMILLKLGLRVVRNTEFQSWPRLTRETAFSELLRSILSLNLDLWESGGDQCLVHCKKDSKNPAFSVPYFIIWKAHKAVWGHCKQNMFRFEFVCWGNLCIENCYTVMDLHWVICWYNVRDKSMDWSQA